jgi:hypothetical protein
MKYDLGKIKAYIGELDRENVLNIVSQDDIMRYYLGFDYVPNKCYLSPLRKERNPSFAIYYTSAREPRFKDFNGAQGTCFDLVMLLHNTSFYGALQIINRDMRLGLGNGVGDCISGPVVKFKSFTDSIDKRKTSALIQFKPQHFTKIDLDYWRKYNIHKDILKKYNVFSCKYVFLNKSLIFTYANNNPVYAYKFANNTVKIYRPLADKVNYKWLSNATSNLLQGYNQLEYRQKTLIITKSLKDVMCLESIGYESVAPQAETNKIPEQLVVKLKNEYSNFIILFDNDAAGKHGAEFTASQFGDEAKIVYIPDSFKCKDISDLMYKYGKDVVMSFLNDIT